MTIRPTFNPADLEPGMRFTSIPFVTDALYGSTGLDIFQGFGFGFMICLANDNPHTFVLKVRLLGTGKGSNDYIYVNPNTWYEGSFQGLRVEPNNLLVFPSVDKGSWVCNVATKSDARAFPSQVDSGISNTPAASGGNPQLSLKETSFPIVGSQAATVAPTLITDGIALGLIGNPESMFKVTVSCPIGEEPTNKITGGGIDLWRYVAAGTFPGWYICQENITFPLGTAGYSKVQIPVDYFGPRSVADRFYATPSALNPITISGTGVEPTLTVAVFIQ